MSDPAPELGAALTAAPPKIAPWRDQALAHAQRLATVRDADPPARAAALAAFLAFWHGDLFPRLVAEARDVAPSLGPAERARLDDEHRALRLLAATAYGRSGWADPGAALLVELEDALVQAARR